MSALLPEGIVGLHDLPYTVHNAILTALGILNYREFPIEERPPKRIWLDNDRLEEWWKETDRKREEKYGRSPEDEDVEYDENGVDLIARG